MAIRVLLLISRNTPKTTENKSQTINTPPCLFFHHRLQNSGKKRQKCKKWQKLHVQVKNSCKKRAKMHFQFRNSCKKSKKENIYLDFFVFISPANNNNTGGPYKKHFLTQFFGTVSYRGPHQFFPKNHLYIGVIFKVAKI